MDRSSALRTTLDDPVDGSFFVGFSVHFWLWTKTKLGELQVISRSRHVMRCALNRLFLSFPLLMLVIIIIVFFSLTNVELSTILLCCAVVVTSLPDTFGQFLSSPF